MSELVNYVKHFVTRGDYKENEGLELERDSWKTKFVIKTDFARGPVTKPDSPGVAFEHLLAILRYIGIEDVDEIALELFMFLKECQFEMQVVFNTDHGITLRISNPTFTGRIRAGEYFNNKAH